jgi:hypothetical protein
VGGVAEAAGQPRLVNQADERARQRLFVARRNEQAVLLVLNRVLDSARARGGEGRRIHIASSMDVPRPSRCDATQ